MVFVTDQAALQNFLDHRFFFSRHESENHGPHQIEIYGLTSRKIQVDAWKMI